MTDQVARAVDAAVYGAKVDLSASLAERVQFVPEQLAAVVRVFKQLATRERTVEAIGERLQSDLLAATSETDPAWLHALAAHALGLRLEATRDRTYKLAADGSFDLVRERLLHEDE